MSANDQTVKEAKRLRTVAVDARGILEYYVTPGAVTITANGVVATPEMIGDVINELKQVKQAIETMRK